MRRGLFAAAILFVVVSSAAASAVTYTLVKESDKKHWSMYAMADNTCDGIAGVRFSLTTVSSSTPCIDYSMIGPVTGYKIGSGTLSTFGFEQTELTAGGNALTFAANLNLNNKLLYIGQTTTSLAYEDSGHTLVSLDFPYIDGKGVLIARGNLVNGQTPHIGETSATVFQKGTGNVVDANLAPEPATMALLLTAVPLLRRRRT